MKKIILLVAIIFAATISAIPAEPAAKSVDRSFCDNLSSEQLKVLLYSHCLGRDIMLYNIAYAEPGYCATRERMTEASDRLDIQLDPDPKTIKTGTQCAAAIFRWNKQGLEGLKKSVDPKKANQYFVLGGLIGNVIGTISFIKIYAPKSKMDPKLKNVISKNVTDIRDMAEENKLPKDMIAKMKSIEKSLSKAKTNKEYFDISTRLFAWSDDLLGRIIDVYSAKPAE